MTDWTLIAQSRKIQSDQMERHVQTLNQLEATLNELKKQLPLAADPAPVFSPIVSCLEKDRQS